MNRVFGRDGCIAIRGWGKVNRFLPRAEQSHTLYAAVDIDRGPVPFNFGIGRGLTRATDSWVLKLMLMRGL